MALILGVGLCSYVIAKFNEDTTGDRFSTETVLSNVTPPAFVDANDALAERSESAGPVAVLNSLVELPAVVDASAPAEAETLSQTVTVKPGDSLAKIFKKLGVSAREVQRLIDSKPYGPRMKEIFPGHELTVSHSPDGALVKVAYSPGPIQTIEFTRVGDQFTGHELIEEPDRAVAYKQGVIDHSLFVASQRVGLDDRVTMRLAQIFQWDVDFVLDIRTGDQFHVLFEELYLGDELIGYGEILAAEFVNQDDIYRAIRYTDANGRSDYYTPTGRNMRKAFLRAPVEFSRISSQFNLKRNHPLHKKTMPHRGIDYVAPTGTPILASGDGKVVTASQTSANGNYVVIQHGEQFMTKYLHLSKFARGVKRNAKVRQGQVIGYVGATGWATGAHLHY
ncbi:MAG: peptidoglycan DD-metalloendopeptidase family protein, partial [Proteobacteria bacterium]|nr:peptidoglycan DD-metalloendopeptidase family protein [Pseudomonadota bacterium]